MQQSGAVNKANLGRSDVTPEANQLDFEDDIIAAADSKTDVVGMTSKEAVVKWSQRLETFAQIDNVDALDDQEGAYIYIGHVCMRKPQSVCSRSQDRKDQILKPQNFPTIHKH